MKLHEHICRSCGTEFSSPRKVHRACSVSCRGKLGGQGRIKVSREEKFRSQMPSGDLEPCWPWPHKTNDRGYGIFNFRYEATRAHRMAFEVFVRPLGRGEIVRHKCDNPPCVNPAHLEPGTKADNMRDMVERGRHWKHGRTECPNGHDLSTPGAIRTTSRENLCIQCARTRSREHSERKRRAAGVPERNLKSRAALRTK